MDTKTRPKYIYIYILGSSPDRIQGIPQDDGVSEREKKRERKNDTGRPSSDEAGSAALFSKGAFIPYVTHFQK